MVGYLINLSLIQKKTLFWKVMFYIRSVFAKIFSTTNLGIKLYTAFSPAAASGGFFYAYDSVNCPAKVEFNGTVYGTVKYWTC